MRQLTKIQISAVYRRHYNESLAKSKVSQILRYMTFAACVMQQLMEQNFQHWSSLRKEMVRLVHESRLPYEFLAMSISLLPPMAR